MYTGDLNVPDFNMTDFTGNADYDFNAPPIDQDTFNAAAAAAASNINAPRTSALPMDYTTTASPADNMNEASGGMYSAADLSDISFTPALIPNSGWNHAGGFGTYSNQPH